MILLDTHIWVWWVSKPKLLSTTHLNLLDQGGIDGLAVSIISCWEVAKLVECGKLELDRPVEDWIEQALAKPKLNLVQLSTQIILDSTRLPQPFHRDPADQLLVATARVLNCPLMTVDTKIVSYVHVRTL